MISIRTIKGSLSIAVFALGGLSISASAAAELYKYVNEDGVTVLDSHVPARYVKNGYTILSLDGRVLEVVPRALTEKEIRERDQELAAQREQEKAERERELADQALLRLYGGPEDVIRARDTKLASIRGFIETSRSNIERLEEQKRAIESALADVERAGGTIDKSSLERIDVIENRIKQIEAEIKDKEAEMDDLKSSYAADLKRVKELYGTSSTDG
ncbi:MAG: hypothetical protein KDI19_01010 [Pseudomonadales bacterium]|nr:hypothetical protein [Pseudomonadales bacterium]